MVIDMVNKYKRLSDYIDILNKEKEPIEHSTGNKGKEYDRLTGTVRMVRTLKDLQEPDEKLEERLLNSLKSLDIQENTFYNKRVSNAESRKYPKRIFIGTSVAVAAGLAAILISNTMLPLKGSNIVYAMEQAMNKMEAYHGVLSIIENNASGDEILQAKKEIWADKNGNYYVKNLEGIGKGMITVNNGKQKWQLRPEEEQVLLFLAFPDPYRFTFELGNEIEDISDAKTVQKVGEEDLDGRNSVIYEIIPQGGLPYHIWVDKETNLPLQKQTSMQNAIRYTITYTDIDFADEIPKDLLVYTPPTGYQIRKTSQEQFVKDLIEAEEFIDFVPKSMENVPEGYHLDEVSVDKADHSIHIYYKTKNKQTVVVSQKKADQKLQPEGNAVLGNMNGNTVEISGTVEKDSMILGGRDAYDENLGIHSIRWQEDGLEYRIYGNETLDDIIAFTEKLIGTRIQLPKKDTAGKPQIEVPVDLQAEENEQKSVDAGHSPWKLDPVFVTQVFASLLISPQGIIGEYPINYEDIKIISNNGESAVAKIEDKNTLARYVYLKRLIRQDSTGIWSVVGYDPVS